MILDPILPLPVVVAASVLLGAFAVWRMLRSARGGRLPWIGRLVMVGLLLVIALRPTIPGPTTGPIATGGLEVYIVLDTTSSMAAEDVRGQVEDRPATRLDEAKDDVARIVESLAGAKFSLTTFDSSAVQRVPLTSDASALLTAVDATAQEITYYSSGSGIDTAVPFVTDLLVSADQDAPDASRVLFYLGDGEQTIDRPPGSFEQLTPFIDGGAVLGYGTDEGGRMRVFDGFGADDEETGPSYIQDPDAGGDALSRVDADTLGAVATQLRVPFVDGGTDQLERALASIDVGDVQVTAPTVGGPIEFYWIFAIPFGVLAVLETVGVALAIVRLRPRRVEVAR